MPLPVPNTIANGFADATGSAYRLSHDQLIIVDTGAGTISAVAVHTGVTTVLGIGYNFPTDIVLSADGVHAYVMENPGTLLWVDLGSADRAAATVIASGPFQPDQIALDEAHGYVYVADSLSGQQLLRINLADGSQSVAATGLINARGVLLTSDSRFVYVSEDTDRIRRFDLTNDTNAVIASGLNAPRHLTWADGGESVILFPQPNPSGTVFKLDLTASPPAATAIAGPAPHDPYSIAVLSPEQLVIVSAQEISQVDLTESVYSPAGPILLGIGFVPADAVHLPGGYADTSMDPSYFFQVKNAPFGGTLPLMINHDRARNMGANFYKVQISPAGGAPVEVNQPYSDYRWNAALNRFELVTQVPVNGFYPLHATGEIWLNYWLGLLLNTGGLPNGPTTIDIKLFSSQS